MDNSPTNRSVRSHALPPTSSALTREETRPYFLWWTECTVGELRAHLASADPAERGYWLGALLREANSRDVWLFTNPNEIRRQWSHVVRHLGRSRAMWAWLLDVDDSKKPTEASSVQR